MNKDFEAAGAGIHQNLLATRIVYVGGVIKTDQVPQFRRLVIRATRCQVFVHSFEMNLEPSDKLVSDPYDRNKSIFVLAYQEGSMLDEKIRRICGGYAEEVFEAQLETLNTEIQQAFNQKM